MLSNTVIGYSWQHEPTLPLIYLCDYCEYFLLYWHGILILNRIKPQAYSLILLPFVFILEISGETEGEWDKARIGQVFSNLLGNAVQYSFNGTPIKTTVKGSTKEVTLSVHNQGVPIPADKAERIFDSLTRGAAENGQEQPGSTNLGLGLYITKEIVTAHGGTIDVISSETNGTTFSARFPRSVALPP